MGNTSKTPPFPATKFYLLNYLYRQLGNRFWLILILNGLFVFLDGIGIAMFVPLLQMNDGGIPSAGDPGGVTAKIQFIFQAAGRALTLPNVITLIILLFTAKAVFYFWSQYYQNRIMMDFVHRMRFRNNEALRTLAYRSFLKKSFGEIHRSLHEEPGHVQDAAIAYLETLKNIIVVLIYLGLSSFFDLRFTLLVIGCGVLFYGVYYFINRRAKMLSRRIIDLTQQHSGVTAEKIYNFKYLKATGALNYFISRMHRFDNLLYAEHFRMAKLNIFSTVIREPLLVYIIALLITVQVLILGGSMASIVVVLLLFYRTMTYMLAVQGAWSGFVHRTASVENMLNFEKFLSAGTEPSEGQLKPDPLRDLSLHNVSLAFDDTEVLHDISLQIPYHKTLALVGESGSGKTTLVNILCGLYTPDKGSYRVNGHDILELDRNVFQQKVGYITQDSTVFEGTLYDNITLWLPKTPENLEKFREALRRSNLLDFVTALPQAENTLLGHNGINLSGGQKQRVGIARELFKDVDLLIMDEATSALDAHTEDEIRQSIAELSGELTIIIIAHRLATIRSADRIVLLEKGRITATGDFAALRELSSYFKSMAALQGL